MAQLPNFHSSPLNLASLIEQSQKDLINILQSIPGMKCLVTEPSLTGSLSLLFKVSVLKEAGVNEFYSLTSEPLQVQSFNVLYLVKPELSLMKLISSHVQNDIAKGLEKQYSVCFVPNQTLACERILKEEKVHNLLTLHEVPLYIFPLDEDVVSFELDSAFRDCLLEGNLSCVCHVAEAISRLELYSGGAISNVKAIGKASTKVAEILNSKQSDDDVGTSGISTLILIDREVDIVTPMCIQLTYEGLIDEILGITDGSIEISGTKIALNSGDNLFKEARDLNFEVAVQVLQETTASVNEEYKGLDSASSFRKLKDFLKKVVFSVPEIGRHTDLAAHLQNFLGKPSYQARLKLEQTIIESQNFDECCEHIEEMIHRGEKIVDVLRLLVLLSVTNCGLPSEKFFSLRREIIYSYGSKHMLTLYNLEKSGLLKQQQKSKWQLLFKKQEWERKLRMIPGALHLFTDKIEPDDVSCISSGYDHLSIRLVEGAIRNGWDSMKEMLKLLPGPHLELKSGECSDGTRSDSVVLVVFIGGVTFSEIAALRRLSSKEDLGYKFMIGTTNIVNGSTMIETLIHK